MSTAGALSITVLELPLRDQPTIAVTVTRDGTTIYDLTNIQAIDFRIFKNEDDPDTAAIIIKTLSDGVAVLPPASAGQYQVTPSAADIALLSPLNLYFFRSVVTPPDGKPGAVTSGYLIITP